MHARWTHFKVAGALALALLATHEPFAAVDPAKLPPAVNRPVDFAQEIQPIFEQSCVRCHGVEKPKGRYSLSTREAALKGGNEGVAIYPGDSARSPLIHYVARLVPEMEMPPEGKGQPLTREQVGLLRAWIDQGAVWAAIDREAEYARHQPQFSATPAVRYVTVSGNATKFQEHQWVRRGFSEGVSDFRVSQRRHDGIDVTVEGRAMTDDYKVTLDMRKTDSGFFRAGFEQYRRYYDNHGGYYSAEPLGFATYTPNIFALDRDLHLDITRAFVEFGITKPDWPSAVFGYEYFGRQGAESTLQWGPVTQNEAGDAAHIYPAYRKVNEDVHVLRLDVTHEIRGVRLENNARVEFMSLDSERVNATDYPLGAAYPAAFAVTRETHEQVQFANALRGEKSLRDWLFVSAGYLFSTLDADADFSQRTVDGAGRLESGTFWAGRNITLDESVHVLNANALLGPWSGLSMSVGFMNEWSQNSGFGRTNYREGDPNDPTNEIEDEPGLVESDADRLRFEETVALRYNTIPATVLFAEGRWKQERSNLDESQVGGEHEFLRDTDATRDWQEYRAGFDVSPVRWASLHGAYKYRLHQSDYHDDADQRPIGTPGEGYSAFIRSRDSESDVIEARLVLRPISWLRTTLRYQLAWTDFDTTTDPVQRVGATTPGGHVVAGESDSATYSANFIFTPVRRWYFSGTFSFRESRTWTEDHGNPSVVPYRGDTYSVIGSSTFAATADTDLTASYSFSRSRYGQHQIPEGVPLGIDFDLHGVQAGVSHRFNTNMSAGLQYGLYLYDEPTSHGVNDYTAHVIFGTLALRWP